MILRATIDTLAKVLAVRPGQAEDVVRSERSARAAFDRRGLFRAAGAVAVGVAFGDAVAPRHLTIEEEIQAVLEKMRRCYDFSTSFRPVQPDDYIFRDGNYSSVFQPLPPAGRVAIIEVLHEPGWIIDEHGNTREVAPIISAETAVELLSWPENAEFA